MSVTEILPALTERIVHRFTPLAIVLFGSQARGDAGPSSDVDLLVVLPRVQDKWQAKLEIEQELRDIQARADVTVTTPEEIARRGDLVGTVLRPALREGKLIYARGTNDGFQELAGVSEAEVLRETGEWLRFAEDELAEAELSAGRPQAVAHIAGFWAQQAAEKALKAVYIYLQVQYPFSHALDKLRDGLPDGWQLKTELPNLHDLSTWAVVQRYPPAQGSMTLDDARRHVRQARALLEAVRRDLAQRGYKD